MDRILGNASVINDAIRDYFFPLYWSGYNIFKPLEIWNKNLKDKRNQRAKSLTPEELEDKVTEIVNLNGEFAPYSIDEKINIRAARNNFNILKRLKGPPSFTAFLYEMDMFKQLSSFIEDTLNEEEIFIENIQKQIDSLTSYYRDMSNLKLNISNLSLQESNLSLQKRLSRLSNIIAISTGVLGAVVAIALAIIYQSH
jgi:hypothetical protein